MNTARTLIELALIAVPISNVLKSRPYPGNGLARGVEVDIDALTGTLSSKGHWLEVTVEADVGQLATSIMDKFGSIAGHVRSGK